MEGARRPEAAEAAKQERTGKEPAGSGKGQGGKAMDHESIGEEQGRSRGERGRKQQERERTWELLTGRTGEGKNQAGNWQQRQNLRRSGKEWETSGKEAWKKLERNQQILRRAREEPGRDGEGPEK